MQKLPALLLYTRIPEVPDSPNLKPPTLQCSDILATCRDLCIVPGSSLHLCNLAVGVG